ncbi:MAG TPA: hypothetical protein VFJ28_12715 [Marmoricola sp.]|nr:hypothetical protein [Marmoricola sp.]
MPPLSEAKARVIRYGTGDNPSRRHVVSVTGAISSTVLTLSSRALAPR